MGGLVRLNKLESAANYFLNGRRSLEDIADDPSNPPYLHISKSWVTRWLRRNPHLATVPRKPIEAARAMATEPSSIAAYYSRLQAAIAGVGYDDIWNMDESGFTVGGGGGKRKIVTLNKDKPRHYLASQGSRENITVVEAISAAGSYIPPFIIKKAKTVQCQYGRNPLDTRTTLATSDTGYTNDILML